MFRVTFSTEIEGQLTTGGLGHIKFWKMAATFTGLKLQGELGKFGRTAISDVEGMVFVITEFVKEDIQIPLQDL